MHDFLKKPKQRHTKEIPLAPILDLLTVVIFFLILSASFIEIRQNTLPPSSTTIASIASSSETIPLNPKLIMANKNGEITLLLKWFGANPGQLVKMLKVGNSSYDLDLKKSTYDILKEFRKAHPLESKIQLGWLADINYQSVLTVVDGAMLEMKDLVFISPEESAVLFEKSLVDEI